MDITNNAASNESLPPLNTFETVSKVVRQFAAEVIQGFASGDSDVFLQHLHFRCNQLNLIFLGQSSQQPYSLTAWNDPEQLGHHVLVQMTINGEHRFGVRDGFMSFANKLIDLAIENEGKGLDKFGPKLDVLCYHMTNILLGVAPDVSWRTL